MSSFKDIPVGTKCFVRTSMGWYITYITRQTKTQVITETKKGSVSRWNINNGYLIGNHKWTVTQLEIFEDKHELYVTSQRLKKNLESVLNSLLGCSDKLSQDHLSKLEQILHSVS